MMLDDGSLYPCILIRDGGSVFDGLSHCWRAATEHSNFRHLSNQLKSLIVRTKNVVIYIRVVLL
jgi:hypothetical protein